MTLIYETEAAGEFGFDPEMLARQVIEAALDDLGCPYEAQVSLLLTGPEQIREMNREFRQIDRATDVLSFPMNDFVKPADFAFLEEDEAGADAFDPESGELLLGDIVINEAQLREQAADYGHSEKREFAFLVVHSVLHLCGFDHMNSEEAQVMEHRQEKILAGLGITRDNR